LYRLSLQGRINVFKTLLLAQISYGGCFLDFGAEKINELQALCNNYVLGTLKVSRDRLYSDISSGGIGLIKIEDYLVAQQAMWVGRAFRSTRDCWKVDLHSSTSGNPLTLNKDDRCLQNFGALKPIIDSFDKFRKKFYENVTSNNEIYILNNMHIKRSVNEAAFLDTDFFSRNIPALNMELVAKLKIKDFFSEGIFKPRDELVNDTNCNFNMVTYFRLRSALLQYKNVYKGGPQHYFYLTGLDEFFQRVTKGSRALRRILSYEKLTDERVLRLTTVKTYFRLAETDIPPIKDLRQLLSTWRKNYVSRDLGDFTFKLFNNCLGLNNRVAHFVANYSAACTFCQLKNSLPAPKETFVHLFFFCGYSESVLKFISHRCFEQLLPDEPQLKKFTLTGCFDTGRQSVRNDFTVFCAINLLNLLWVCKTTKSCKSNYALEQDFILNIDSGLKISQLLREKLHESETIVGTFFRNFSRDA
jgi:hypothetical protein